MVPVTSQPLWAAIAEQLRSRIGEGNEFPPGSTLPTESDLVDQYDAARQTIRVALLQLTNEGLLDPAQRSRGRQVRRTRTLIFQPMISESQETIAARGGQRDSWTSDVADQGYTADQTISVAIEVAGPDVAPHLGLGQGSSVVVRRRVRYVDGRPHNTADTYYPHELVKGSAIELPGDIKEGTIAYLTAMGYPQLWTRDEVTARMPSAEEAGLLSIPPGTPVLIQRRTGYSKNDLPIKLTVTTWPADRAGLAWEIK